MYTLLLVLGSFALLFVCVWGGGGGGGAGRWGGWGEMGVVVVVVVVE